MHRALKDTETLGLRSSPYTPPAVAVEDPRVLGSSSWIIPHRTVFLCFVRFSPNPARHLHHSHHLTALGHPRVGGPGQYSAATQCFRSCFSSTTRQQFYDPRYTHERH